jgi:hypothetical protein
MSKERERANTILITRESGSESGSRCQGSGQWRHVSRWDKWAGRLLFAIFATKT